MPLTSRRRFDFSTGLSLSPVSPFLSSPLPHTLFIIFFIGAEMSPSPHHGPITRPNNSICTELFVLLLGNAGDSSWLRKHLIPVAPRAWPRCDRNAARGGVGAAGAAGLSGAGESPPVTLPPPCALLPQAPEPGEGGAAAAGPGASPGGAAERLRRHRVSASAGSPGVAVGSRRAPLRKLVCEGESCVPVVLVNYVRESVSGSAEGQFRRGLVSYLHAAEARV